MQPGGTTARLLLLVLIVGLSGCSIRPGASKGSIQFQEIFEARGEQLGIVRTVELDVDGDNEDEWLVFYRYDRPVDEDKEEHAPIQATVYDAVSCDPPVIHQWRLPFPDNDYVGEGEEVEAYTADWLASSGDGQAAEELIIEGPGPANTLSIYRFADQLQNPCLPPDNARQGFQLLGFFRANGEIVWNEETKSVTTYQRTRFERSQLAIRSVYAPRTSAEGETFLESNGQMMGPKEQSVDFLYGAPASPLDSPYPEKAVVAFYQMLGRDNERAIQFLTSELAPAFYQQRWGLDLTPDQISRALIYSISYKPDREAELARHDREVTVVIAAVDHNNQRLPARRVTWRLVGIPIPNEQDCEWRLAEITSVVVTEGLGMAPQVPPVERGIALVR